MYVCYLLKHRDTYVPSYTLLACDLLNVTGLVCVHMYVQCMQLAYTYMSQVPSCPLPIFLPSSLPPPTAHCHTHHPASSGAPNFSKYAPWRYRVEYSIGNYQPTTQVLAETFFSRSGLSTGTPFTIRVIAEGQPGYISTSPRFTVVPQSEGTGLAHLYTHCLFAHVMYVRT